jgi:hypothetical protein
MAQMKLSRAELVKRSAREMAKLAVWIALGFFVLGLAIAVFV